MTILDKIIEDKRKEVSADGKATIKELEKSDHFSRETISLSGSLLDSERHGIIAEFKRQSPSKGVINSDASVIDVTAGYIKEGASGLSVLTDKIYFGGSAEDLTSARKNVGSYPILRKDFIIDEYQVIESKSIGADAILLIAAALKKSEVHNLARLAQSIGLEVLLEIHNKEEIAVVNPYVNIIGVNNRNLKTFEVDVSLSERLVSEIPSGFVKISESGISSQQVIKNLKSVGYNGFLIGERFMSKPDPVKAFAGFVNDLISLE